MPTAKAGAQCRVPVPSPPRRYGGKRGWWGQARPMGAVSRRAKSLVNTTLSLAVPLGALRKSQYPTNDNAEFIYV